ncbi:MAG: [LysW]-lysine hydrolase [Candidatus Promineifilaceae bacterium]|nr:[LysW]-lysine hydrolase [Candidatus Promineifilaceae bacterium]
MSIDAVHFLQELVSISSISGEEEEAATYLVAVMESLGMEARVDEVGNAVGVREGPDGEGWIEQETVLLGHVDTVPGEIPVRIEDGRLYGRGSVDAKGPLATFVMAAARAELAPGRRLVVVGAVEEEAATSKGARHVADVYRPDACIIGEPSGWDGITLGYKGRLLLDYVYRQPMSHSAGPQEEVAEAAVAWWNEIAAYAEAYNRGRARLFDQLFAGLRHIQTESDGLTNSVTARVGLRLPPGFDAAAFAQRAKEMAGPARVRDYGHEPAFRASRQTDLVRAFNVALRQSDRRPRFKLKTGTSDMNIVGPRWGCPIVAYGPGDSRLDHTPQEQIAIDEYLQAISILTAVLSVL